MKIVYISQGTFELYKQSMIRFINIMTYPHVMINKEKKYIICNKLELKK